MPKNDIFVAGRESFWISSIYTKEQHSFACFAECACASHSFHSVLIFLKLVIFPKVKMTQLVPNKNADSTFKEHACRLDLGPLEIKLHYDVLA